MKKKSCLEKEERKGAPGALLKFKKRRGRGGLLDAEKNPFTVSSTERKFDVTAV